MQVHRSDPTGPGFRRLRGEEGFIYLDPEGAEVSDPAWIEDLVIPPAWQEVWICPDPRGHIQATGRDVAGRLQYLYHPAWRQAQDAVKFERALDLATVLTPARASVTRDLAEERPTHERALAAAFRLLDTLAIRIGSEAYLDANGSRGLCTLLCRHADVDGDTLLLRFPGKSGKPWESATTDAALAAVIGQILQQRGPRARLLCWHTSTEPGASGRGRWRVLTPEDVNADIHRRTGGDFTAKDFRTLHGSASAAQFLARAGTPASEPERAKMITAAVKHVADLLGNTQAVARESYIDPRILEAYQGGAQFPVNSKTAESALVSLLR